MTEIGIVDNQKTPIVQTFVFQFSFRLFSELCFVSSTMSSISRMFIVCQSFQTTQLNSKQKDDQDKKRGPQKVCCGFFFSVRVK